MPLTVALTANLQGSLQIDLYEVLDRSPDFVTKSPVGPERGRDGHGSMLTQQAAYEADTPNVLVAIFLAESQALGKMGSAWLPRKGETLCLSRANPLFG